MITSKRPDKKGVSAVVTFVLLTSVAMIFIGNWLIVAVPNWGTEEEVRHTKQVENQFVGIRASAKSLVYADNTQFIIPNSLTLGTNGAAWKGVARANGDMELDPAMSRVRLNDSVTNTLAATKGNLVYSSDNQYYNDQSIAFESGAIIRSQDGNSVMIAPPEFSAEIEGSEITLKMVFISLTGDADEVSGNIDIVVYTRLQTREYNWYNWTNTPKDLTIDIQTEYPGAWYTYYQTEMMKNGFTEVVSPAVPINDGEFGISYTRDSCTLSVSNVDYFETTVAAVEIDFN